MPDTLRLAARVPCTAAEGPFNRYALWVQGCAIRCRGCCNPGMFPSRGGKVASVDEVARHILWARDHLGIEGVTILGGEPLQQIAPLTRLLHNVGSHGLGVLLFSGHLLENAVKMAGFARLWETLDTLVDGPFDARYPEPANGRRWIGSRNQRMHHRTARYSDPTWWKGENHAEAHIETDGRVSMHGWPSEVRRLLRAYTSRTESGGNTP